MISIIGIGRGASQIAQKFSSIKNYEVYCLNDKIKTNTDRAFKLKKFKTPEEYEKNIPDLREFFSSIRGRAQIFVMGSSMSSNYVLGVLQQIKHKDIDLFYVQPDVELLTGMPRVLEKITFGILQEYARSGLFRNITFLSNLSLEQVLGEIPIKTYYEVLNETIFSTVHYLNFFEYTEPEIGMIAKVDEINRIRSVARLDVESLEEKWFFGLDTPSRDCVIIYV